MTTVPFSSSNLAKYQFDIDLGCVVSYHSGSPRNMKWSYSSGRQRISITTPYGDKLSYSYAEILNCIDLLKIANEGKREDLVKLRNLAAHSGFYYGSEMEAAIAMAKSKQVETKDPASVSNSAETILDPSLFDIAPAHDFVAVSNAQRCSQYFGAGTSIGEVIKTLRKRGLVVDPKELQFFNPHTQQVTKLDVQVVETFKGFV